jgi:hypothetical protein
MTYGRPEIEPLLGGSGGGGGGNRPPRVPTFTQDSSGGSGGGGGGALLIRSSGTVTVASSALIDADGGTGGIGVLMTGSGPGPSSGAGGGSGGAVKIQADSISEIQGTITAVGGAGGAGGSTSTDLRGGAGGNGRIRFEDSDGSIAVGSGIVTPTASTGALDPALFTTSFAQSQFFDTNVTNAFFRFDASSPFDGSALLQPDGTASPGVTDVVYIGTVDPRVRITYEFSAARARSNKPNEVDPATVTDFVPNIESLNGQGFQFIRFRVTFQAQTGRLSELPLPIIDSLRVRFDYF